MPVGKESIKRAASAEKKTSTTKRKTTTKTAKTTKAAVAAEKPVTNVIAAPSEEVVKAVVSNKSKQFVGIKDELPIYLL
ncbi:MAG: hypothetical protein Q4B26_12680 [Eubacteriales bacterium]|nr:hypothetical protein [Eubacteriales bacterium]